MRGPHFKSSFAAALLAVLLPAVLATSAGAKGESTFATRIASGGPIGLSCDTKGRLAGRVSVDALVGYSDLRKGLERRLAKRKGSGALRLTLRTANGKVLARDSDRDRVGFGTAGNRVHHTQELTLGKAASARVLRYAQGAPRCDSTPPRGRPVEVTIEAQQRLGAAAGAGGGEVSATPVTKLRASGEVVGLPGSQSTSCAPYPCYQTAAEVLGWNPGNVRAIDVADVPRANRVPVPGPRLMTGFDNGDWAYWSGSDLNSQGAPNGNVFNFSQWQYVDSLYYYSHNLLSVPPTVWVNAAHRNGVGILASVTGDCDGCGPEMDELFEKHGPEAVNILYSLAATYGFDGWMIDVEREAHYSPELLQAMKELGARRLPSGRQVQVVTYEAFQTTLNEEMLAPFLAAGEWQADYDHGTQSPYPQQTYDFLGEQKPPLTDRRYDTYWATDVYRPYDEGPNACGRRSSANFIWNGFVCNNVGNLFANLGSARAGSEPPGFLQSLALYAPGWTAFGGREHTDEPPAPRAASQAAEERFWPGVGGYQETSGSCRPTIPNQNSVSALLTPRSALTQVPFYTNFNTGEGDAFAVQGQVVGKDWNLLSAQDAAPTALCSQSRELGAALDYGNVYDGGSSLEVAGRTSGDARRLYLYEASAPLPTQPAFRLRYFRAGSEPAVTVWIDGKGPYDLAPSVRRPEGNWTFTEATLPANVASGTLTKVGVVFAPNSEVKARIGELGIVSKGANPPTQISPAFNQGELTWTDPTPTSTRYYNVWAQPRGASCSAFLGRTTLRRYLVTQSLFPVPREVGSFRVQPVSTSGLAAPLSPPAC